MWHSNFALGVINVLVPVSFVASGLLLLSDRQTGRTGWGMIFAAPCYAVSWWWGWPMNWQVGPAPLISFLAGYLWFVTGGLALLRYPEPVLARRHERTYFWGLAGWIIGFKLVLACISRPAWSDWNRRAWWPSVFPDRDGFHLLSNVFSVGLALLTLLLPVLLLLKLRRTRGLELVDALPVTTAAGAIGVVGSSYLIVGLLGLGSDVTDALRIVTGVMALVAPIAFLVSLTQRRLARASVADFVLRLATCSSLKDVQVALREVLGDPSLVLALREAPGSPLATVEGQTISPHDGSHWEVAMPGSDGTPLAVLLVDESLQRRTGLVQTAAMQEAWRLRMISSMRTWPHSWRRFRPPAGA